MMISLNRVILPFLGNTVLYRVGVFFLSLLPMRVLHEFRRACELPAACRGSRDGPGESRGRGPPGAEGQRTNAAGGQGRARSETVPSGGSVFPRKMLPRIV